MATEIKRTCARCGAPLPSGAVLEICKPCDDILEAQCNPLGLRKLKK